MNSTIHDLSMRLVGITQEIDKQETDKRAMSSGYTAAIGHLKTMQKKVARLIADGCWTDEDLVEVGVRQAPVERLFVAACQGES